MSEAKRHCERCGSMIMACAPDRRFCSRKCHIAARRKRRECQCQHCGRRYMPKAVGRTTYCSRECAFGARRARAAERARAQGEVAPTECAECGNPVASRRAKYCSDGCRRAVARRRERRRAAAKVVRRAGAIRCPGCGVTFRPKYGDKRRRFCSRLCARREERRKRGPETHRTRARRFGVEYEPINRMKVFWRDRWRCGICRDKIDRRLKHPHPMSATLDHIVPMSEGGPHRYENVQAAHWLCNVSKGNGSAGEQLLLIG